MADGSCSRTAGSGEDTCHHDCPGACTTPSSSASAFPRDQDEQLQRSADALCRWLQESEILDASSPAYTPHVTGKSLVMPDFITEIVRCICLATHQQQLQRYATDAGDDHHVEVDMDARELKVVASCLDTVFEASWGVHVDAMGLLQKALAAGAADFEPLSDIVWFWKHVLVYAALCESRERHVKWIFSTAPDFQSEVVQMIQQVENSCAVATDAPEQGADVEDGVSVASPSPAGSQPERKRRSSLSLLGVTPRRQSADGRSSIGGTADLLGATPAQCGAAVCTPAPQWSRQSASADSCGKDSHNGFARQTSLTVENETLRARVKQLEEQAHRDKQIISRSGKVLDGEFESFCISWDAEKQLKERYEKVKELEAEVQVSWQKMDDYNALFEEVQILRHQKGEHEVLKERYARCEEQIGRLTGLAKEGETWKRKHTEVSTTNAELMDEVERLQAVSQTVQIWKRQALENEAAVKVALMDAEEAKKNTENVMKKAQAKEEEHELLRSEHAIFTAQLQDAQLLRVADAEGSTEIVEPFTYELQEQMRALKQRNAFLEQRFTEEQVMEREELKVIIERLEDRAERAEGAQQMTAEECKQLQRDLEVQQSSAQALKVDLENARADAAFVEGELERCKDELERSQAELEAALNDTSKVEPLEKELEELKVRLLDEEEKRDELAQELEELQERFAERARQVEELEPFRMEALSLRRQTDALNQQADSAKQLQQGVLEVREIERQLKRLVQEKDLLFQKYKRHCEEENEKLRLQLQHSCYEKDQAARNNAGLAEREDEWEQKQGVWGSMVEDLKQGLLQERENKLRLEEQVESLECKRQHLEELAEQKAPVELQLLRDRLESGRETGTRRPSACLAPDYEAMLQRREVQRLKDELTEHRLREADLAQQLRRESAKSRQMERSMRANPALPASASPVAGSMSPAVVSSRSRPPLQELPVHEFLPKGTINPAATLSMEETKENNRPLRPSDIMQNKLRPSDILQKELGHKASGKINGLVGSHTWYNR